MCNYYGFQVAYLKVGESTGNMDGTLTTEEDKLRPYFLCEIEFEVFR